MGLLHGFVGFLLLVVAAPRLSYAAEVKGEWEKTLEAAKREGRVVIYGPPGSNRRQALVDAFQRSYPEIRVEYIAGSGREQGPRVLAERKAGKFLVDLHIGGTTTMSALLKPAGALEPIRPYLVSAEVTRASNWFGKRLWFADNEEQFNLMFQGGVSNIIAINTRLVEGKEIASYWDLLKPKWRGKIVSSDIRQPGPGGGQSRFLYSHPALGPEFFKRLFGEAELTLSLDRRQMADWLAQGKYAANIFPDSAEIEKAMDIGLPVGIVLSENLKEGAPLSAGFGSVAVFHQAPHPSATKIYLNWLLSREGQTAWQKFVGEPSLRTDIARAGIRPWNMPQEKVDYFFASLEKYEGIELKTVQRLITEAMAGKGR